MPSPPDRNLAIRGVGSHQLARRDPTLPAILEFQSPSVTIVNAPVPVAARGVIWSLATLFGGAVLAMGLIKVDRVVVAPGRVVSKAATIVVQPLETGIIRSIEVKEGDQVRAGDILARLDPTFAIADTAALRAQVSSLGAEVARLKAEAGGDEFTYAGSDPSMALQAAISAQRRAELAFRMENYRQKLNGLVSTAAKNQADVDSYRQRLEVARDVESIRNKLEKLQVGSKLNSLQAADARLEMERGYVSAYQAVQSASRDLEAMRAEQDAYAKNRLAETSQKLAEQSRALSDASQNLSKSELRRQLVELRAAQDATVLTVAKVSTGSVLQSGDQLVSMIPASSPMEVEANVPGRENGFVHVGDKVTVKFDTFPFTEYGTAEGEVRSVSADSFVASDDARSKFGGGAVPGVPGSTEPYYRTRITLDHIGLHDVPSAFRMTPGMPVTAEVKVGERTMLTYLLGRVLPVTHEAMREP